MVLCWILWGLLGGINLAGYLMVARDKHIARAAGRRSSAPQARTPEQTFHLVAALGGWLGEFLAMRRVRHKTRKRGFQVLFAVASIFGTVAWVGWLVLFECIEMPGFAGL